MASSGNESLLDDLLAASIDGLCVFDRVHRCTHWNAAMERITGIAPGDARGKTRDELLPEDPTRTFSVTFQPASDGGTIGVARKTEAAITEMLSVASHKLKTPLTALQIHLGAQLRGVMRGNQDKAWLERSTQSAIEQSMRMADTINMLVDVSRMDSGRWKLDYSEFDLAELAQHTIGRLKHTASDNGCEVKLSAPGKVSGLWDRVRLEEVLATLLANAFKHGAGKPVDLALADADDQVKLTIADHGPGIEPEELPAVFQRGPRTAFGLWIAKEIVAAHHGTIEVQSGSGGSTFTLMLPKAPR
ncbi:MAG: PAS domain-containing sensor histidine kinase [Archangiaceae bacterium]|nr:PAS domain-containing sensor histidine kinase [Archangiaceae bacterium]